MKRGVSGFAPGALMAALLVCGLCSTAHGDPGPSLPLVNKDICEGEDCAKQSFINDCRKDECRSAGCASEYCSPDFSDYVATGKVASDMPLHVRGKPLASKIAFVIPKDAPFEILGYDLYTLESRPHPLSREEAEACDPRLPPRTTVYTLYYAGEGFFKVWHSGRTAFCALRNIMPNKAYKAQLWYRVRYEGLEGWWGDPVFCSRVSRGENCPRFGQSE